ncbi:signal transduction histidine kinase [Stackebrandtia albiflava]|uniref:histidine kinase n=1 Tax=Stackebrandtia albiflava TaxID=406432 RepID=A0A562UXW6_9ACTN|nr:signal transduction histidine kinase [Stackebrandtia albiflava]
MRRVVSLLIDTGPPFDGRWRFRFTTVLALVGPGSVPFAVLLFAVQNQILRTNYGVPGISLLIALLTGISVLAARFHPLAAWLMWLASAAWAAVAAVQQTGDPWPLTPGGLFALLVVQFAVARDARTLWALTTWVVNLLVFYGISQEMPGVLAQQNLLLASLLSLAALLIGVMVRASRRARRRVEEEARLTAEERTRRRLLEERTRIARELHDVVAHHMSVITVQAATAPYRLPDLPEDVRAEFHSIGAQARQSLAELRRLLTVLRNEDDAAEREPLPGMERLAELVESVRRSGTPVDLRTDDVSGLPEAVALTGYRIVQEALSNVVRHAPGAAVAVRVAVTAAAVEITVVNSVPPEGVRAVPEGAGLGLAGMRERVTLLSGELSTVATDDGGFRVHAVLPLGDDEEDR